MDAAKAKELASRRTHKVAESELKSEANNILKSRWVFRWKKGPDGKRIVKARLVVKGF